MADEGSELVSIEETVAALATRSQDGQVFGTPVQQGETTLVPVARVRTGGGVSGNRKTRSGGAGTVAEPMGAWVVTSGGAEWRPTVNVNLIVLGGQVAFAAVGVACAIAFRRKR
ncbi:hypothetical protein ACL03H_05585 [Saccharopolyspora sp. MS10]|uniref:hypothetical protein n=1 Tax=Saccharopolyspora sp. MS10 TaxID=3385973 RepID=UPI0039A17F0A